MLLEVVVQMITTVVSEQKDTTSEEWAYNIWTDSNDWCSQCSNKNNKLLFDDQTKTTKCTQCGHVRTFDDKDWKSLQTQRQVIYQYMPGKYIFSNLSIEEIFAKYLREHNHVDWSSWVIHDYVLARMRNDKEIQNKLQDAAKLIVEKMDYDPKPWLTLFEKMDAQDPEIFLQVPQIIYEYAEKQFQNVTTKENLSEIIHSYAVKLTNIYCYNRWKGDRAACWITSEIIKLCNPDSYLTNFYTDFFSYDPMIENFPEDLLTTNKMEINTKDSYIQWELNLSDNFLKKSNALGAVEGAYNALGAKLGIHAIWPPTNVLSFDMYTVKKVTELFDDSELFRFYDLATDLNTIDPAKACYYAKLFSDKIKKMLPEVTSLEQEQAKKMAYVT